MVVRCSELVAGAIAILGVKVDPDKLVQIWVFSSSPSINASDFSFFGAIKFTVIKKNASNFCNQQALKAFDHGPSFRGGRNEVVYLEMQISLIWSHEYCS